MFEPRFGRELGDIRLHTDQPAGASARAIGARAFALGPQIAFAPGQYQPDSREGQRLIAHEVAHVALGHGGVRRREDMDLWAQEVESQRREEERQRRAAAHTAWGSAVDQAFSGNLAGQSRTIGAERERLELAMTSQRAAALDAVAGGAGWLGTMLQTAGYAGPGLPEVRAAWANALVTAELVRMDAASNTVSSQSRLAALDAFSAFYLVLEPFARAAEQAHSRRAQAENDRLRQDYETRLAAHERRVEMDRMSGIKRDGEGGGAAAGAMALMRGPRPGPPAYIQTPPAISASVAAANSRVTAAESVAQWQAAAEEVKQLGNGLTTLVSSTLPKEHGTRTGLEYLEQLDQRLAGFEAQNAVMMRIPAVFYPEDRMLEQRGANGETLSVAEGIPWQFYLIHTGVTSHDRLATSGGEWVLVDLTSSQRFENRAPSSDIDAAMLQQGASVDPPLSLFGALNSRLRFPTGRLYFKSPRGKDYILQTTEPWSLSDWLRAVGLALAALALVAGVIATGGAAAAGAIAVYAGIGSAAFSIGGTFAEMQERSEHGALTKANVDEAAISIGIDLVSMFSLGFGRLLGNAAKLGITGERLLLLQRATQISRAASLSGNVYQVLTATAGFVSAFRAIEDQPGLTDAERSRRRGELVRRALLTGALLTVAIRGDVKDLKSGRIVNVAHVDQSGVLVPHGYAPDAVPHGGADAPAPHADVPAGGQAARGLHTDVAPAVHGHAETAGTGLRVGPQTHAVGVGGRGRTHDFYFCSDLCAPLRAKFEAIVEALPRNHPEREIFQGLLSRARGAGDRLRRGRITQEEADGIARSLSDDIARHSRQSEVFSALMNTNIEDLIAARLQIRAMLARSADVSQTHLQSQSERQAANRGASRGRSRIDEPDARSPLETDLLGGVNIQAVDRASRRLQALHFDTGNFSHTHAEALVPGLPRGLNAEVPVTLPNGTTGRADRVRFIYDDAGNRIGAHVYEIKPNTPEQIAAGQKQAQGYVDGLKLEIENKLREKGLAIPATAPDGGPLFPPPRVMPYDQERMMAVLRALRASRRDYAMRASSADIAEQTAQDEAIARAVFGGTL